MLATLGACTDGALPKWITGEPTKAEVAAYNGPIAMPAESPASAAWPNLADVPPRPKPRLTTKERADEVDSLKKENAEGQAAIKDLNAEMPGGAKP